MGYIYDKFLKDIVGKNPRGEDPRGLQTGAITFTTGK